MKTAKETLLLLLPNGCWWEDMQNLTNTPFKYVEKAMMDYAKEACKLQRLKCAENYNRLSADFYEISKSIRDAPEPDLE